MGTQSLYFVLATLRMVTTVMASGIWQRGGTYPAAGAMIYKFEDVCIQCLAVVISFLMISVLGPAVLFSSVDTLL